VHFYWAPLEADDPLNGGKVTWGTGGLQLGMRCARNARINAKGFAPKNYPVAGKDWAVNRTGIRQLVRPSEQDESDLAKSKINPVIFQTYNGGGRFVFNDSLTAAKSLVSYRKLINVAEMSSTVDNWVALYAKELVQLPMGDFIRRMNAFLQLLFEGAQSSGWLVPSKNAARQRRLQVQRPALRSAPGGSGADRLLDQLRRRRPPGDPPANPRQVRSALMFTNTPIARTLQSMGAFKAGPRRRRRCQARRRAGAGRRADRREEGRCRHRARERLPRFREPHGRGCGAPAVGRDRRPRRWRDLADRLFAMMVGIADDNKDGDLSDDEIAVVTARWRTPTTTSRTRA
jgi:hypothetical protein